MSGSLVLDILFDNMLGTSQHQQVSDSWFDLVLTAVGTLPLMLFLGILLSRFAVKERCGDL